MSRPNQVRRDPELDRRKWVDPPDADLRLDRIHGRMVNQGARGGAKRPSMPWLAAGALAAAAALALAWFAWPPSPRRLAAGTTVEVGSEPSSFRLTDGSSVEVDRASRVELLEVEPARVRVAIRRGGATFEVRRDKNRDFIVEAEQTQVRVVGTRFSVRQREVGGSKQVEVIVWRGAVEATTADGTTRRLGAGERWSVRTSRPEPDAPAVHTENQENVPAPHPPAPHRSRAQPGAAELLAAGASARRAGQPQEAEQAYRALLRRHPRDSRATLAAFELGRLRMDALNDPGGAAQMFERVVRRGSSPFREHALARLVLLYEQLGQRDACKKRRRDYEVAYPQGPRAADVARRCPDSP